MTKQGNMRKHKGNTSTRKHEGNTNTIIEQGYNIISSKVEDYEIGVNTMEDYMYLKSLLHFLKGIQQ